MVPTARAFEAATKIQIEKQKDYRGIDLYFPFKDKSYLHEINKKTLRLMALTEVDPEEIANESVEDNLLDLINYAAYYYEYLMDIGHECEHAGTKAINERDLWRKALLLEPDRRGK